MDEAPPFQHTASDQKLDGGKAWERGYLYPSSLFLSSGKCCDEGKSFLAEVPDSPAAKAYHEIIQSMACDRGL